MGTTTAPESATSERVVVGRVVTYVFLALIVAVAVTGTEAWPLSSFALFSKVRTGESVSTRMVAVDLAGTEHPMLLGSEQSTRGSKQLAAHLGVRTHREQVAMVSDWMRSLGIEPSTIEFVRLYRVVRQVSTTDRPGPVLREKLVLQIRLRR